MLFRVKKHEANNRVLLENNITEIIATQMSMGGYYYKPKIGELVKAERYNFEWLITAVRLDKDSDEGDITLFNDNIEIELKNSGEININNTGNVTINISGNAEINASKLDINNDVQILGNLNVVGEIESTISVKAPLIQGQAVLGATVGTTGARKSVDLETLDTEHQQLQQNFDAHVVTYNSHVHSNGNNGAPTGGPE